eukprot:TRINITY_DN1459_c0_g1_i1.p1 TRINITY_DN1459_c0_g1~~TRINITY_DN1459_c0_g1_i1.p1  ORF type:complete len:353 (+),score=114.51 TRINITY_DN1459_c0_g1_i1:56-1114(+)
MFLMGTSRFSDSAWEVGSAAQKAMCVGCVVYAGVAAYKAAIAPPKFTSETQGIPAEEMRASLAAVQALSAGGALTALAGVQCFKRHHQAVPLWVPLSGAGTALLVYVTQNWKQLFSARNNKDIVANTGLLGVSAFLGGWASAPIALLFDDFLFSFYAPVSIGTLLGYAAAAVSIDSNSLLLLVHGPLSAVVFGAGAGSVVACRSVDKNYAKAAVVSASMISSLGGAVALSLHGTVVLNSISVWSVLQQMFTSPFSVLRSGFKKDKSKDEEEGIDVATTALCYVLAGAALFYKAAKRCVRAGVKMARGEKAGKKGCCGVIDYDSFGATALLTTVLSIVYMRSLTRLSASAVAA